MHVVQVNYVCDPALNTPQSLLDGYATLTGWGRALAASGARVTVVQRFATEARAVRDGVEYLFTRRVNHAVAGANPDVVHINGLVFPIETWRLGRRLPPRVAIVVQDHAAGDPADVRLLRSIRRHVRRRAFSAASGFMFAAAEQADAWRDDGTIAPHQPVFEVMEAAPALARIDRADARRTSGITGSPALLWVGRLNANKDPLRVLAGFERALPHLPDATLTMVYQEDDLLLDVTRRVRQAAELRERVRLVGAVRHDRLAAYYSAADLFVLGSHREGSGYALLEACACGAVPVVTDIPSFRVITDRGRFGALWRAGDAAAFARALVQVASRDVPALSAAVMAHVNHAFSWRAIATTAAAAYQAVMLRRKDA